MKTHVDVHILKEFECLEPEIGEEFLLSYPEFLSEEDQTRFELHLEGCEYCQERWKLWQATGLVLRIKALAQRADALLAAQRHQEALHTLLMQARLLGVTHRYAEAVEVYNQAISLNPAVSESPSESTVFSSEASLQPTAAWSGTQDILDFLTAGQERLVAAKASDLFPVYLEYASGNVQGKLTSVGRLVFFELTKTGRGYENGIILIGKILRDSLTMFKLWKIQPGKKTRLDTHTALFGSVELSTIIDWLKACKVFPMR